MEEVKIHGSNLFSTVSFDKPVHLQMLLLTIVKEMFKIDREIKGQKGGYEKWV